MDYQNIRVVAFDADDTLWINETIFNATQEKFAGLLEQYVPRELLMQHLYKTEVRNLEYFGYGIKGFILSMIETAVELTEGLIKGGDIQMIIDWGRDMIAHPVELLPTIRETLQKLHGQYELVLITKGDLMDQESKLARSGLADFFKHIEIVSDKSSVQYQEILQKYDYRPEEFLMVGNSLKSDIMPVLEIGAEAVYIPFESTWEHEKIDLTPDQKSRFESLENMAQLAEQLSGLKG
ncbi:HAD family hydrolase [Persicobacter diffluens]|uniref:Haloacid dehalogenase n=1 Tax=Persicobacter diffluens TaxID=981 RepID=A0AAN5AMD7_9BACT|nr:haloacid dehalogenase [Persicobacter diffluens]